MSGVTLQLDGERWREHLAHGRRATPGLVPVIKGNGYGFGLARLAEEAAAARRGHHRGRVARPRSAGSGGSSRVTS